MQKLDIQSRTDLVTHIFTTSKQVRKKQCSTKIPDAKRNNMNRLKNFFYLKLSHFEKKTFFRSAMKHRCSLSLGWIKLLKANNVFKFLLSQRVCCKFHKKTVESKYEVVRQTMFWPCELFIYLLVISNLFIVDSFRQLIANTSKLP